jgi:hypothetical protein
LLGYFVVQTMPGGGAVVPPKLSLFDRQSAVKMAGEG